MSVREVPPPPGDQESVEIDYFLENSMAGSSFLYFDGEVDSCGGWGWRGSSFDNFLVFSEPNV